MMVDFFQSREWLRWYLINPSLALIGSFSSRKIRSSPAEMLCWLQMLQMLRVSPDTKKVLIKLTGYVTGPLPP